MSQSIGREQAIRLAESETPAAPDTYLRHILATLLRIEAQGEAKPARRTPRKRKGA